MDNPENPRIEERFRDDVQFILAFQEVLMDLYAKGVQVDSDKFKNLNEVLGFTSNQNYLMPHYYVLQSFVESAKQFKWAGTPPDISEIASSRYEEGTVVCSPIDGFNFSYEVFLELFPSIVSHLQAAPIPRSNAVASDLEKILKNPSGWGENSIRLGIDILSNEGPMGDDESTRYFILGYDFSLGQAFRNPSFYKFEVNPTTMLQLNEVGDIVRGLYNTLTNNFVIGEFEADNFVNWFMNNNIIAKKALDMGLIDLNKEWHYITYEGELPIINIDLDINALKNRINEDRQKLIGKSDDFSIKLNRYYSQLFNFISLHQPKLERLQFVNIKTFDWNSRSYNIYSRKVNPAQSVKEEQQQGLRERITKLVGSFSKGKLIHQES